MTKSSTQNPFERFDLDPREGPAGITERLRELAQDAGEAERAEIRAAWEELTLHPLRRLRAAIGAHPRHPDAGRTTPEYAPHFRPRLPEAPALSLSDLAPRPSIAHALAGFVPAEDTFAAPPSLDDDPVLATLPVEKKR